MNVLPLPFIRSLQADAPLSLSRASFVDGGEGKRFGGYADAFDVAFARACACFFAQLARSLIVAFRMRKRGAKGNEVSERSSRPIACRATRSR